MFQWSNEPTHQSNGDLVHFIFRKKDSQIRTNIKNKGALSKVICSLIFEQVVVSEG